MKAILIFSDSYSLSHKFYPNHDDAQTAMQAAYNDHLPEEDSEWFDNCYCGTSDAQVYDGDTVYLWEIINLD